MNARGFKLSEVVQLKPAVTGTARNDDGTSQGASLISRKAHCASPLGEASRVATSSGMAISTPNFCAWV